MKKIKSFLSNVKDLVSLILLVSLVTAPVVAGCYYQFGSGVFYFFALLAMVYVLPSIIESDALVFLPMFVLYWFTMGVTGAEMEWSNFILVTGIIMLISKVIFTFYLLIQIGNKKRSYKDLIVWFKFKYASTRRERMAKRIKQIFG